MVTSNDIYMMYIIYQVEDIPFYVVEGSWLVTSCPSF